MKNYEIVLNTPTPHNFRKHQIKNKQCQLLSKSTVFSQADIQVLAEATLKGCHECRKLQMGLTSRDKD